MAVLAQVAVEYGVLAGRDFMLTMKQQVAAIGAGPLLVAGAVVIGLVLLTRRG